MKSKNRARKFLGMLALAGIALTVAWGLGPGFNQIRGFHHKKASTADATAKSKAPAVPASNSANDVSDQAASPAEAPSALAEESDEFSVLATADEFSIPADASPITAENVTGNSAMETGIVSDSAGLLENETEATEAGLKIIPVAGTQSPQSRRLSQQQLENIAQLIERGQDKEAHKQLSAWYWNFPKDRARFQKEIEVLAKSIYFSPQPLHEEPYVIQSGDQLRKIARNYQLSWKYLARLNRINPRKIRVGQKLKVVKGPFDAVIDLSDFELTVLCHGQFVRRYPVGIGKDGTSPIGKFTVKDKLEDPTYYGPDGVIANDAPDNPLGERWIDIGDSFGIHGTINPESIGKSKSRGCIRMLNDDVAEVYDFLTIGSTVWIRR